MKNDWPTFVKLWNNYPDPNSRHSKGGYVNECAIRLSITLIKAGVSFKDYTEPVSPEGWARGAESLAVWLWNKQLGKPRIFNSSESFKQKTTGQYGIVFFKDCFVRAGQTKQLGDHIDCWYQGKARSYDDPNNKAKQAWFWKFT